MNVVIAAGGTLGHIRPAINVANKLIQLGHKVYFITLDKNEININKGDVLKFDVGIFNRKKLFKNIITIIKNNKVKKEINTFYKNNNIDLVISFGSAIGTVAISAALKNKKIKTIIHEQNKVFGFGNKMVYKKVDKVLLTFPIENVNGKVVGNPVEQFGNYTYYGNKIITHILITCGTNGAKYINDFFIRNIEYFKNQDKYAFILIAGDKYYNDNYEKIIKLSCGKFSIYPKQESLVDFYKRAGIIICRSGSTTLSEALGMKKLVITIPSKNVTNNHQYHNALFYSQKGMLEMIPDEKQLDKDLLMKMIETMIKEKFKYIKSIKENYCDDSIFLFINEINKMWGNNE